MRIHHRSILPATALVVALAITASAQTHPNLSGTWRVERVDVQNPERTGDRPGGGQGRFGRGGRRGGFGGGGFGGGRRAGSADGDGQRRAARPMAGLRQGDTLRIRQTDDRLIETVEGGDGPVMNSYTFDGKETKAKPSEDVEIKSKSSWEGLAFVTNSTQKLATGRGEVSLKVREVRTLSEDGQTLTVTTTTDTPFGKRTATATLSKTSPSDQ